MYKEDLALNNLQWLICQRTQPNYIFDFGLAPVSVATRIFDVNHSMSGSIEQITDPRMFPQTRIGMHRT